MKDCLATQDSTIQYYREEQLLLGVFDLEQLMINFQVDYST